MPPRPAFFIVRPPAAPTAVGSPEALGPIVPLIAVDELPDWIEIPGAPRELAVEHIVGLKNLGTWSKTEGAYSIRIAYSAAAMTSTAMSGADVSTAELAGDGLPEQPKTAPAIPVATGAGAGLVRGGVSEPSSSSRPAKAATGQVNEPPVTTPGLQNSVHNPNSKHPAPQPVLASTPMTAGAATAATTASPANETKTTTPSPSASTPSPVASRPEPAETTEYCCHWCHHGTCKWGAQCRYLHAMPTTVQGLIDVGLSEFPQWWIVAMFRSLSLGALPSSGPVMGATATDTPPAVSAAAVPALGTGTTTGTGTGTTTGINPSPLRPSTAAALAAMRSLGAHPHPQSHPQPPHHHQPKGQNQNQNQNQQGSSPSNKKLKAQLREAVSLLHQLGVAAPGGYNKGGGRVQRGRGITPLDRKMGLSLAGGVHVTGAGAGAGNGNETGSVTGLARERLGVEAAMAAMIRDGVQPLKMGEVKGQGQGQQSQGQSQQSQGQTQLVVGMGQAQAKTGVAGGEKSLEGGGRGVQGVPGAAMQSVVEKLVDV